LKPAFVWPAHYDHRRANFRLAQARAGSLPTSDTTFEVTATNTRGDASSQTLSVTDNESQTNAPTGVLAFPGAEGFGRFDVRFRMGKIGESGKDTVTVANGHDLIWDHCSLSWARDGNFDLNQESGEELYNLTLQDSIVAQGLQTHSTGGLVVTRGTSILRSLYIDNNSRNPKARGVLQFVNNVIYNWVDSGYILGDTSGRSDGYLVGNYFIRGPETTGDTLDSPTPEYHVFANDNWYDDNRDGALNGRLLARGDFGTATWEPSPSADFPAVDEMTAEDALVYVSEHAGASLWRDAPDTYVVTELSSMGVQGATISDESSLGLPNTVGELEPGTAVSDTDRDGMPDVWESAQGFDAMAPNDRNGDHDTNGHTNLEEYLNSLTPLRP
jgi:hypothetical protein